MSQAQPSRAPLTRAIGRARDFVRVYGARAIAYGANLSASKAIAYCSPLVLATILPEQSYGALEFGFSSAQFIALVIGLGITSAVPQMLLLRNAAPMVDILGAQVATTTFVALAAAAFAAAAGAWLAALALAMTSAALAQNALAALFRTMSRRNLAVWTDSFATFVMLAVGTTTLQAGATAIPGLTSAYACVAMAVAATAAIIAQRLRAPAFMERLRRAARLGLPLLAYSLVAVWIATSGRLLIGATRGVAELAGYAFVFRAASAVAIIHLMFSVAFFSTVYRMRVRPFDALMSVFTLGLGALCLMVSLAGPALFGHAPSAVATPERIAAWRSLGSPIAMQMFGWLASSMLETRISRYRLGSRAARVSLVIAIAHCAIFLAAAASGASLRSLAWIVALQSAALTGGLLLTLGRRGIVLPKLSLTIGMAFAALAAAGAF